MHIVNAAYTHSHYVIYVVETDDIPDTSTVPDSTSDTAYVAIAASAAGRTGTFTEVVGDGRSDTLGVTGGSDVEFYNRAIMSTREPVDISYRM